MIENDRKKNSFRYFFTICFFSVGLEPPAGDVNSIADCQEWGRAVQSLGADFFYFSGVTEMAECQMFASIQSSCSAIGGPAVAPPMEECEGGY